MKTCATIGYYSTGDNNTLFVIHFTIHLFASPHMSSQPIISAQVVETSVTNNSPSQDSYHPDGLFQSRYATPGFKPFSYIQRSNVFPVLPCLVLFLELSLSFPLPVLSMLTGAEASPEFRILSSNDGAVS